MLYWIWIGLLVSRRFVFFLNCIYYLHDQPQRAGLSSPMLNGLLGNAKEFGLWPWPESLCANQHFFCPSVCQGADYSCTATLAASQRHAEKRQHLDSCQASFFFFFFKYNSINKSKPRNKQWKNSFLWTGPACAFLLISCSTVTPPRFPCSLSH